MLSFSLSLLLFSCMPRSMTHPSLSSLDSTPIFCSLLLSLSPCLSLPFPFLRLTRDRSHTSHLIISYQLSISLRSLPLPASYNYHPFFVVPSFFNVDHISVLSVNRVLLRRKNIISLNKRRVCLK